MKCEKKHAIIPFSQLLSGDIVLKQTTGMFDFIQTSSLPLTIKFKPKLEETFLILKLNV